MGQVKVFENRGDDSLTRFLKIVTKRKFRSKIVQNRVFLYQKTIFFAQGRNAFSTIVKDVTDLEGHTKGPKPVVGEKLIFCEDFRLYSRYTSENRTK